MHKNSLAGYKLIFSKQAQKDLLAVKQEQAQLIRKRIHNLMESQQPLDIKKMIGAYEYPTYRLRCGDYRVIYEVRKDEIIILIVKIGHRRDVYLK